MIHHATSLLPLKDLWLNIPLQWFSVKALCSNSVSSFCLLRNLDRLSWRFLVFLFLSNCTILGAWAQEIILLAHLFFPVPRSAVFFRVWPTFDSSFGSIEMKCIQNRNFGSWTVVDLQLTCPCAAPPVTVTCWCCRGCLDFSARIGSYSRQVDRLMRKSW